MSDWAEPFVGAGWAFDDTDQTVASPGDWQVSLGVVIDSTGRWHVRMATHDAQREHLRSYGFKRFHLLAADEKAYARFVETLLSGAQGMTKKSRTTVVKEVASLVNAAGATMVWFKAEGKKVQL